MVENYNDVEPVSEAIVEPIVYKSCNFKLLIVSIIVTPVIYLTPWEVVKAGLFFLLLFLYNIVVFQDLIKCLPVKGKKGHVSTGSGWNLNPISFIYYYTYSKEKITLDKIIVQILRCIILACIFIIVCILVRFAMLNPSSQWDEFSIHKPYNYLQWIPILLISYFIFVLVDFLFLQRLYGLYITIRKVSKEHIQQVDGELYYINPEEKEISQEEDIVEISIEEQNRKANKKNIFMSVGILLLVLFAIGLRFFLSDNFSFKDIATDKNFRSLIVLLILILSPAIGLFSQKRKK